MGNQSSQQREDFKESLKYGRVFIETESRTFKAGERVEGTVHVEIKNLAYPTNEIVLSLTGVEKTRWTHEAKVEGKEWEEKKPFGVNVFLEVRQVLRKLEDNYLHPGFYAFPFSVMLPEWIPSSFLYSGDKAKKLSILYTIKVRMEDIQTNKAKTLPALRGKRRLLVS
jgi:hypothetical protein